MDFIQKLLAPLLRPPGARHDTRYGVRVELEGARPYTGGYVYATRYDAESERTLVAKEAHARTGRRVVGSEVVTLRAQP